MPGYDPKSMEKKWQAFWLENKTFAAPNVSDKPKFYALDMFPYPSGKGLHVGHPEGYTATDIVSRYKRARGFAVMHPMGWDAFGLPAEQTAIKDGVHPRETTTRNIETFRRQLQALGFSYDWDREVDTTDVGYYRWTQWIFLQLFDTWFDNMQQKGRTIGELIEEFKSGKRRVPGIGNRESGVSWDALSAAEQRRILEGYRLAYEAEVPVNWCAGLGTVLSNEEVIDGKSAVGNYPVERRPMRQWLLRITAYSERLIDGLNGVQWSESLKEMQRNWIGKSEGAEVVFQIQTTKAIVEGHPGWAGFDPLAVFTTRPDTLFGASYMVIAPEHSLSRLAMVIQHEWPAKTLSEWTGGHDTPGEAVKAYSAYAKGRSDRERQEDTKKTGVFTGLFAVNPVNATLLPIFVSDYVLMGYGTGAIMAVPAHDDRDHEFATKFKLPIVQVVAPKQPDEKKPVDVQKEAFTQEGIAVNSPWIEGLPTQEAKKKITAMLEEKKIGKKTVNYKIRDWLFSRQRYWGEPFPLVHLEDGTTVPLAASELPLKLPELEDFKPTGTIDPPLSKATAWVNVWVVLDGGAARVVPAGTAGALRARRELNTMPQWAGSCWYYIRYTDARNDQRFVDPAAEKFWLHDGVDLYVGGVEHAVLHLLYSRFWHKVLFDRGLVSCDEPFRRLVNQGLILGEAEYTAFQNDAGNYFSTAEFESIELEEQTMFGIMKDGTRIPGVKVSADMVEKKGEGFVLKSAPAVRVDARSFKMSKSRGNVVNPDDVIEHYGADSLRLFEMFMGPLEQVKPWSTAGVEGVYRFLQRVWRNMFDENDAVKVVDAPPAEAVNRALHKTIKRVTDDIDRMSFNTAIAAMMEFNNVLTDTGKTAPLSRQVAVSFLRLLEPFAPHFAEEVHARVANASGPPSSITVRPWPVVDPALLVESTLEIPVQVNGKLRGRITVAADADEATILSAAVADAEVQKQIAGKEVKKKIYVKGRMVNLVV